MTSLTYNRDDYNSGDGMLTSVWGPSFWHYLHTISFNYPVNPTAYHKKHYKTLILNLEHTLPCSHCRNNIVKNLKKHPLTAESLSSRDAFSRWMFDLHEIINKMLCKKSNLTYELVRDRYENFRSRCTKDSKTRKKKRAKKTKTRRKKEKGCTVPTYGKKSRCIIKIVPQDSKKQDSFQMDKQCYKKK
jgi:hypothetical protein